MKISSAIKLLVVILAVVFIGNQIISSVYKPIKTETAVYYTTIDGQKISGIIIRNETLVDNKESGVLHFVTEDGSRVAKNGVIADIYSTENASITVSEINSVKNKISDIEDILSYNDIEAANLDLINKKVDDGVNNIILSTATGNYSDVGKYSEELLSSINRRQASLGTHVDFSNQLDELNSKLTELNASLPTPKGYVKAQQSGYFVSKTDGYEDILNIKDLATVTSDFLKEIKPQTHSKDTIGKIVSDYEWYIAANISLEDSLNYKEGKSVKLATSLKATPELSATIKKINTSQSGSEAVIIFACNDMNSELATMRSGNFTVITSEHSGLKVSKSALRVVDGQRGVYTVSGMQVKFVPIEIVYNNDEYILCKKGIEKSLKLYDSVVVKGKNLYDGKIVS